MIGTPPLEDGPTHTPDCCHPQEKIGLTKILLTGTMNPNQVGQNPTRSQTHLGRHPSMFSDGKGTFTCDVALIMESAFTHLKISVMPAPLTPHPSMQSTSSA